jgi:rhodanese-related sulfurtransferase
MQEIIRFATAHWPLFLALLAVLIVLIKVEWDEGAAGGGPTVLSPQQAVTLINHEQAVVVDMRNLPEYTAEHIAAAISMPLDKLDSQLQTLKQYSGKPLIVYGIAGRDFEAVKPKLEAKGFPNIFNLTGGLAAWKAAGMPVGRGN